MRRRIFVTGASACATAWATGAGAKASRKVGILTPARHGKTANFSAFRRRLRELDYVEGEGITIVFRFADGQNDRLPALAAELFRERPTVLVADGVAAGRSLADLTSDIPIVIPATGAPVQAGFAQTLARPGHNITGFSIMMPELIAKRLELLTLLVPRLERALILQSAPSGPTGALAGVEHAKTLGIRVEFAQIADADEIAARVSAVGRERPQAIIVAPDAFFVSARTEILAAIRATGLPAMFGEREFVEHGGLISYGAHIPDLFRRAADYVARILGGAAASDLPFEQASTFELVINLKTAAALELAISPNLLARADEVIE